MYNVGEHTLYPGPIDNSGLFSGNVAMHYYKTATTFPWLNLNISIVKCSSYANIETEKMPSKPWY